MARFVMVGSTAINQEHIVRVDIDDSEGSVTLRLDDRSEYTASGFYAQALKLWLRDHVRKLGSDALQDYADTLADQAMNEVDDL